MMDSSIDLMQYAIGGAGAFILVAVCILALFFKGSAKREARREMKRKKKEAKKEQQQVAKANKKASKKATKKANKKVKKKAKRNQAKIRPVEVAVSPQEEARPVEVARPQVGDESQCVEVSQPVAAPIILYFYKVQTGQIDANKRFVLENYLTIGRNTGYHHWTIEEDMTVSGNHCKIYQRNNELYLLDLNSTNGTYVNGQRVRGEIKISNHDKMRIGQTEYRIGIG